MTLQQTLLLLHILGAMLWVGGGIVLTVLSAMLHRSDDLGARLAFVRYSNRLGPVMGTAAMVVLGAGIGMVVESPTWAFSQTWVWLALVLIAVSMALGGSYYKRAGERLEAALADGEGRRSEADRMAGQMVRVSIGDLVLMVVIVSLMVFKPGV